MSDAPDLDFNASQDFTAAYKVSASDELPRSELSCLSCIEIHRVQKDADDYRKARTHARDRRTLHPRKFCASFRFLPHELAFKIMPTANKAAKAVFDNGKTSSYHINSLFSCQSGKTPSSAFRIVVHRGAGDGAHKRYEFEAENPKIASECRFLFVYTTMTIY
jgi:hypothetical protein